MISIRIAKWAKNAGKSISDLARETGLNRNTITALYRNRTTGVKLKTIEKICSTYGLPLTEVLTLDAETSGDKDIVSAQFQLIEKPYKESADFVPFTVIHPVSGIYTMPRDYFPDAGMVIAFAKKEYGIWYYDSEQMTKAAGPIYERYKGKEELHAIFRLFEAAAKDIEAAYRAHTEKEILQYSDQELLAFAAKLFEACKNFWKFGLFIDVFDAGYDLAKIEEIKMRHGLSSEEVAILTTPLQMTFNNERLFRLLELSSRALRGLVPKDARYIEKRLTASSGFQAYVRDFDYYKSNYSFIRHISASEEATEVFSLIQAGSYDTKYTQLSDYEKTVKNTIQAVLKRHTLKQNPLYFFQQMIFWREYRKQVNLMSIHLMHYMLRSIEQKTGIPYTYAKHLLPDEMGAVLKGALTADHLKKRYEQGVLIYTTKDNYRIVEGAEAQSICDEMERRVMGKIEDDTVLRGQVACQGYVKGKARIILTLSDFPKFKDDEILVTSMTRPEYVPLMKRASAIVTDEGGIACHAAIVSRELGKPCIVGTQKATQLIKDGDIIEVRANHGTVKILSRAS